jgi:spermidine synthase
MVGVTVTALTYSGLGTGISANAFAKHGMATTILEIDPAVYDAARQYFGLSDPGSNNVFLQDAREWVRTRRAMVEAGDASAAEYDIVVHDCFSGGGVPEHLFSIEFWNDLKTIISSEGVVAVVRSFRHCVRPITYLNVF